MSELLKLIYLAISVFVIGDFFLRLFFSRLSLSTTLYFNVALALGLGSFLYGCLIFLSINLGISKGWYLVLDVLLFVLIFLLSIKRYCSVIKSVLSGFVFDFYSCVAIFFLILSLWIIIPLMLNIPIGAGDPITNWNLKSVFIYGGWSGEWKNIYWEYFPRWMHADYPLYYPLITVRGMIFELESVSVYQIYQSVIFYLLAVVCIFSVISYFYGKKISCMGLCLLVSTPYIYNFLPLQHAEVFFFYFYSVVFCLLLILVNAFSLEEKRAAGLLLVVFSCVSSWVKNEGFALALIITLLVAFTFRKDKKYILKMLFVFASTILLPFFYKVIFVSSSNDLVSIDRVIYINDIMDRISSFPIIFVDNISGVGFGYATWMVLALGCIGYVILDCKVKLRLLPVVIIFLLMLLIYFVVLITIPHEYDFQWFIKHSISRLFFQILGGGYVLSFAIFGECYRACLR